MELRQDKMTHRERMEALYNYQKPDRVPLLELANIFMMVNVGYTKTELQTHPRKAFDAWQWTCEQYGWETEPHNCLEVVLGSWNFGAKMKMPDRPYSLAVALE